MDFGDISVNPPLVLGVNGIFLLQDLGIKKSLGGKAKWQER